MTYLQHRLPIELLQICIVIGFVYWVYAANRKIKKLESGKLSGVIELRIASFFLLFFMVIFVRNNYDTTPAKNELKIILDEKIESIEINGNKFGNTDALVSALKDMCNLPPHHSHTIENLQLTINTYKGSFQLELQRDSKDPNEYWVYFRAYSRGVIGYVCTNELSKF